MNIKTVVRVITTVLGVLGIVFLFRIIGVGDDEINAAASDGDFSTVSPLIILAKAVLYIAIGITLLFSLRNILSDGKKLKKSLLYVGCFAVVVAVGYALSSGVETPLKDNEVLSASASRWVETGLRVFYILAITAILLMVFSKFKRILK